MTTRRVSAAAKPAPPRIGEILQFERFLAELSARFINLPAARVDDAITDSLRRIVELLGVDRSLLIRFTPSGDEPTVTHSWTRKGVPAVTTTIVTARFPWAVSRFRVGQAVVFSRLDALPPEAGVDTASWERAGVRSHLSLPMSVAGRIEGAIALACLGRGRAWPDDLVERVRALATIFGNALAHKRAQEELDASIDFERTLSDVLAALLTAPRVQQDRVIEAGLRDLARAFGAERATLWRRLEGMIEFSKTHRWLAEGLPTPPDSVGARSTPWISAELVRGSVVRFARHTDLPPEAAADLPGLQALGIRATLAVPLTVAGVVVGALAFAMAREDREWPEALVPRVKLLGEVFASVLARQDAERREHEAQVQAAHAARVGTMGVFAASLVHELTQPLAASLANAEIAAELVAASPPDLDELRATIADIVADDRRAGELIQQLRRFLRRGEVQRAELAPHELVDEVLRLVATEATDKGIAVTLDFPSTLPKIMGDRVQIEQVLLNLLLNGFDAVAGNEAGSRRVSVRADATGAGVSIEVADTGRGMDESILTSIFQPFFTTKPGGMGLGLSISRTIVAAHGGTLSVHSTPGSGTTFRIELPLQESDRAMPTPRLAVPRIATGTVFVIDDDASMRRAIERQLEREGFAVETFESAQAYLDRTPATDIACIVSDVRMPGLSGLDLQTSLAHADHELPIVFISGHGDIQTTVHAMKAGAVSFLAKPFAKRELLGAVAEALAQCRLLAATRQLDTTLKTRYESLTPREREVFALVAAGLPNKLIADRLGTAESTVKIHRGRVMEKMGAASAADLVRMAERLGVALPESAPG
jgi:FixJ family two-component response regulator/signal transduction histidine kinase